MTYDELMSYDPFRATHILREFNDRYIENRLYPAFYTVQQMIDEDYDRGILNVKERAWMMELERRNR